MSSPVDMLRKEWLRVAQSVVKKRGKKLSDLSFARRTTHGYAFFIQKHVHWDILHEITEELALLFPHLDFAFVAEASSELANSQTDQLLAA